MSKSGLSRVPHLVVETVSGALRDLWNPPAAQIPFLDGLRTIAVLLVINSHLDEQFVALHGPNLYSRIPFVANGWIGVDLFFVLSGFFIGGQLWKELKKTGKVEIKRFILRRGFRIWPLYFFTYICVLGLYWRTAAEKHYGWSDLVFLTNYVNKGIVLGSWSLCTEEQFYILAPVLLAIFATRDVRRYQAWLWLVLALPMLNRIGVWYYETGHFFGYNAAAFSDIYYKFNTHCDGLIMGMIVANVWQLRKAANIAPQKLQALLVLMGGTALLVISRSVQHATLIFTGLAFFFGALAWFGLNWNVSLFNSKLFYWGSRLSFGMYLNHAYFVPLVNRHILPHVPLPTVPREIFGFLLLSLVSALLAVVTFCLVEHPFLVLRGKWLEEDKQKHADARQPEVNPA